MRSSVFYGLGNDSFRGGPLATVGERSLEVGIERPIFWNNYGGIDLPGYDPASYALSQNLVQDPALLGVGGNVTGDPRFVDAPSGDFHLRPDSPARGVAAAGGEDFDLELDPRGSGADDDRVDLGADEFFPRYQWFHPRPRLGKRTTYRILGEPGDLALAFAAPLENSDYEFTSPPLGIGWQLERLLSPRPFAVALIGADGVAGVPLVLPRGLADVRLVGLGILTQAMYLTSQGETEYSANVAVAYLTE